MIDAQESGLKIHGANVTFVVIPEGAHFLVYFNQILLGLKRPRQP